LGIGTVVPSSSLHIVSTTEQLRLGYNSTDYAVFQVESGGEMIIGASGGAIIFSDAVSIENDFVVQNGVEDNVLIVDTALDKVGIDIDAPLATLHVSSTAEALRLDNGNNYVAFTVSDVSLDISNTDVTIADGLKVGSDAFFVDSIGNQVGIGISLPQAALHVSSSVAEVLRLDNSQGNSTTFSMSANGLAILPTGSGFVTIGNAGSADKIGASTDDLFVNDELEVNGQAYLDNSLAVGTTLTVNTDKFFVDSNGYTGMGTASPGALLHIINANGDPQLRLDYDASNSVDFIVTDGGFTVSSSVTTTFNNDVSIPSLYSGMLSLPEDGGLVDIMDIPVSSNATANDLEGYNFLIDGLPIMTLYGEADGAGLADSLGVMIGTTTASSSYKLYVDATASTSEAIFANGYIKASGFITGSTTLDLAETYPIDSKCEKDSSCPVAGDVICSVEKGNAFVIEKCKDFYAKNVLGVISTKPGFILGDYNFKSGLYPSNYRVVALAGRVPVKVSNANGVIKAGDYLTSSDKPGVAVKAVSPGKVIGVALQSPKFNGELGATIMFINSQWYSGSGIDQGDDMPTKFGLLDSFTKTVKNALRKLGLVVKNGVAKVKELRTNKLCVGDTCITETQLQKMLQNNNSSGSTPTPDPVTPDPVTPDPVTPDPVTPDPVTPDPVTPDPVTPDPVTP
jgi:hypothetical protein